MAARILIADDDPDMRHLLRLILRRRGYQIIEARDGQETLARASEERPDLILLDIMMPRMSGFEVCRRLQADKGTVHIPIIFLTAKSDPVSRHKGLRLGARDFISKMVGPKQLIKQIEQILDSCQEDNAHLPLASQV